MRTFIKFFGNKILKSLYEAPSNRVKKVIQSNLNKTDMP